MVVIAGARPARLRMHVPAVLRTLAWAARGSPCQGQGMLCWLLAREWTNPSGGIVGGMLLKS
eukprot:scaffold253315_cov35-Tisochrysis_lutea.AAC.6